MNEPIKRHNSLKPLSRDHHHALLLVWKIRQGFKRGIPPDRIKRYADWFWKNHLAPHFDIEERDIFIILGNDNALVKKALAEHRRLKRLFEQNSEEIKTLSLIEEELESHIRFEERILFNAIQKLATPEQLDNVKKHHLDAQFTDNCEDEFWK